VYNCGSLHNTALNSSELIFSVILQTITTAQMISIGGRGDLTVPGDTSYSLFQTLALGCIVYPQCTDGQTDDSITPIGNHTSRQYDRLKRTEKIGTTRMKVN